MSRDLRKRRETVDVWMNELNGGSLLEELAGKNEKIPLDLSIYVKQPSGESKKNLLIDLMMMHAKKESKKNLSESLMKIASLLGGFESKEIENGPQRASLFWNWLSLFRYHGVDLTKSVPSDVVDWEEGWTSVMDRFRLGHISAIDVTFMHVNLTFLSDENKKTAMNSRKMNEIMGDIWKNSDMMTIQTMLGIKNAGEQMKVYAWADKMSPGVPSRKLLKIIKNEKLSKMENEIRSSLLISLMQACNAGEKKELGSWIRTHLPISKERTESEMSLMAMAEHADFEHKAKEGGEKRVKRI